MDEQKKFDLVERALFLAAGQNDPHSTTITDLCAELTRYRHLTAELAHAAMDARPVLRALARDGDVYHALIIQELTDAIAKAEASS